MPQLEIYLFGKFAARCDQRALDCIQSHKALELFCYLLLNYQHTLHRDVIADKLWGEDCSRAKMYLRKSLWQLQNSLNSVREPQDDLILLVEGDWLQINRRAEIWVDTLIFENAYDSVKGIAGQALSVPTYTRLQQSIQLYRGDLLEGWYMDWCVFPRERYREMYLSLVDKLMGYCEANQIYELGVEYGNLILSCDRARERTHQRLMRLYYLAGNRTAALRQFECCKKALREELDVQPSRRTCTLRDQVASDEVIPKLKAGKSNEHLDDEPSTGALRQLARLKELVEQQQAAQQQVAEQVSRLERPIKEIS